MRLTDLTILTLLLISACTAPVDLGARDGGSDQGSVGGAGTTATTSATTGGAGITATTSAAGGQPPVATGVGGQTMWSALCGNAIIEAGESCDDSNTNGGDGCSATCLLEAGWVCPAPGHACVRQQCGDGEVQIGEACDLGQANGTVGANCASNCRLKPIGCGDAIVDTAYGEFCDDGINQGNYGGCAPDCTLASFCGDGVVDGPEQCDLGRLNNESQDNYNGCTGKCTFAPYCGDAIVNGPEQCDDGVNDGRYGGCAPGCMQGTYCGDGVLEAPEQCDYGSALNTGEYGGCTAACKLGPYCGDGIVASPQEECDNGALNGVLTNVGVPCSALCMRVFL